MFFHYNVGDHRGGILCPKRNFGEGIVLSANSLHRFGEKEAIKTTRKARSSQSHSLYALATSQPVVVRGREDEGIKVYGYGKTAYELLLGYILDPEYGDVTDSTEGTDITLTYTQSPLSPEPTPRRA